jgi:hypothetical protein
MDDWKSLAARRHSWSVMAGAAAVLALPMVYPEPRMMHYVAAVILTSGVVSSAIEGGRWVWNQLQ